MGKEHVIPEFINRIKKIKNKNFKFRALEMKQDHSFISMIL